MRRSGVAGEVVELSVCHHVAGEMNPNERLMGDAMVGDSTLFAREDAVEAAWAVVDPVLAAATLVHLYERGSWGPVEADRIVQGHGRLARPGAFCRSALARRVSSPGRSSAVAATETVK